MTNSIERNPGDIFSPEIRIVGNASKKLKKERIQEFKDALGEKHLKNFGPKEQEEIKNQEYKKTPEELELLDFANKKTNELMEEVGVNPYNIPEKNFHILPPDLFHKIAKTHFGTAVTEPRYQSIYFSASRIKNNSLLFGNLAFHELLHLKSHYAIELTEIKEKKEVTESLYRLGLYMGSVQKIENSKEYHEHFCGLNEGIVSWQEQKFRQEMINLPSLKEEKEYLNSPKYENLKQKISKEKGVSQKDILWISPDGKKYETINYSRHLEVIDFIFKEIQAEFKDQYSSLEEINKEFLKSLFTGRLITIAKLIEKTFGKESFRVLGMMGRDDNSAIQMFEFLHQARATIKRERK